MLKLLVFLPCEKIIISEDGLVTVVSILDTINTEPKEDFTENTAMQILWETMSLWYKTDQADSYKAFEQQVEFRRPNGSTIFSAVTLFKTDATHTTYRVLGKIGAFPVGVAGTLWLKVSIRETGNENKWLEVAEYPIVVNHLTPSNKDNEEHKIENKQRDSIEPIESV